MARTLFHVLFITFIILFLIILNSMTTVAKSKTLGLWLLNVREKEAVSVTPDGKVLSSSAPPTIYSLFRVELFRNRDNAFKDGFTFESMATHSYICMDSKGNLITIKRPDSIFDGKKERRRRRKTRIGESMTSEAESEIQSKCLFHYWNFGGSSQSSSGDWNHLIGIYMEGTSRRNITSRRFIAFRENGTPRRYSRPMESIVPRFHGLLIRLGKPPQFHRLLNQTKFLTCHGRIPGNKLFQKSVQNCLLKSFGTDSPSLVSNRLLRKNLLKIIDKCTTEVEDTLCSLRKKNSILIQFSPQQLDSGKTNFQSHPIDTISNPIPKRNHSHHIYIPHTHGFRQRLLANASASSQGRTATNENKKERIRGAHPCNCPQP